MRNTGTKHHIPALTAAIFGLLCLPCLLAPLLPHFVEGPAIPIERGLLASEILPAGDGDIHVEKM